MEHWGNSISLTTKTRPAKTQCSVRHRGALDRTLLSPVCLYRVTNVGNCTKRPTESPSACLLSLSTTSFALINSRTKWTSLVDCNVIRGFYWTAPRHSNFMQNLTTMATVHEATCDSQMFYRGVQGTEQKVPSRRYRVEMKNSSRPV